MIKTAQRERSPIFKVQTTHTRVEFSQFGEFRAEESWAPPSNIYQVSDAIVVCVDLAGVDHQHVEIALVPGRLKISGTRLAPAPPTGTGTVAEKGMRIISMEIDHGRFCRTIATPETIAIERSESEYRDGLLWIKLPFKRK